MPSAVDLVSQWKAKKKGEPPSAAADLVSQWKASRKEEPASPAAELVSRWKAKTAPKGPLQVQIGGKIVPTQGQPEQQRDPYAGTFAGEVFSGRFQEGVASGMQRNLNRLSAPLAPVRDLLNRLAKNKGELSKKYGGAENVPSEVEWQGIQRALKQWAPWQAFKRAAFQGEATDLQVLQRLASGDRKLKKTLDRIGGPAVGDFLLSFAADAGSGRLQGLAVGGLAKGAGKLKLGQRVTAAAEHLPTTGRLGAVRSEIVNRPAYQMARRTYSMEGAKAERLGREMADVAEEVRKATQKARKAGAQVRTVDPVTKRSVNEVDRLVADYVEAGAKGARHEAPSLGAPGFGQLKKEAKAARKVLPSRKLTAAQAQAQAAKEQGKLLDAETVARLQQGELEAARKGQQQAAAAARQAREKAQAAQRQAAVERRVADDRSASVAQLRARQQERMATAKKAEQQHPALEQDAAASAKLHAAAQKEAADLRRKLQSAEREATRETQRAKTMVARADTPGHQTIAARAHIKARDLREGAKVLKQQVAQAEQKESRLLQQMQTRQREAQQARAAAEQARRLTPSQGMLQAARDRANTAQERAGQSSLKAAALQQQAKGEWSAARQAQQPVTKATREAGQMQQALRTQQGLTTRLHGQAERATVRAQKAESRLQAVEGQMSTPMQRLEAEARRQAQLPKVQQEAQALGIDYADVQRIGEKYRKLSEKIGKELVDTGALSAEAYERLRGFHLPRYYLLRSSKPAEAEKFLVEMERKKLITPEAAGDLRREWEGVRRGGRDFSAAREIEEFSERVNPAAGRIAGGAATPSMARYTASAQREIGERRAQAALAANPALAVPRAQASPEQLAQWKNVTGEGPLSEHLVHPGVARYLQVREQALKQPETWAGEQWAVVNKAMRRHWLSAPRTAANNAAGNLALITSALNVNGVNKGLLETSAGYAAALKEYRQFQKTGKMSPALKEALEQTDILSEGAGVLPRDAKSFGTGFGVETLGEKLKAAPAQLLKFEHPAQQAYANAVLGDVEKAARFHLFRELRRAGKSVDEARDIVQSALIDYSATGPLLRWAERNNITPFVTFPLRAVFQFANTAARRPDVFQTISGERLRVLADTLADEKTGGKARARERRRQGEVSPMEFPLPGLLDETGQQRYLRAPILAPALQLMPSNPDADLVSERIKSALPLFRLPLELATNRNTYTGREIVPPGLPPGEGGSYQWLHAGRALLPQVRDLETLYHALTDTTQYASAFMGKPRWQDALLSYTLGVSEKEGKGDTSLQAFGRAAERMRNRHHEPYREEARRYLEGLDRGEIPIDGRVLAGLEAKNESLMELNRRVKDATKRYEKLLTTDEKSGQHRSEAIKGQLQYLFALKQVIQAAAAREQAIGR